MRALGVLMGGMLLVVPLSAAAAWPAPGGLPAPVAVQRFPAEETHALRSPYRGVVVPYTAELRVRGSGSGRRVWLLVQSTEDGAALFDCTTCEITLAADDAEPLGYPSCRAEPYAEGALKFDDARAVLEQLRSATVVRVTVPLAVAGDTPGVLQGVVRTFTFRTAGLSDDGPGSRGTCDRDFHDE